MKRIILILSITLAIFSSFSVGIANAQEANIGFLNPNIIYAYACEGNTDCIKNCTDKLWWSLFLLGMCI
ncbi:hypothetical protein [Xenorhabdus ishibashii]|uniref:Uncharacterized protein n=1 Tax=Xenorhabdus ishibashii TaxID=1034471 RepID=A0A2D0K9S4_9GAMM|nr:hypothetical protein [Xenorhabdus ishibashii]PHM60209.1 hypothetical protein Xish_03354 [Xenorhabdus ishibashii]